jgi:hypothetical protein
MLDAAVDSDGVGDASSFRIPGFPYLRTNRFLLAQAPRLATLAQKALWIHRMQWLDWKARETEISNLRESSVWRLSRQFGAEPYREALISAMVSYSSILMNYDRNQAGYFEALKNALPEPEEYSLLYRTLGVYPLTALPVLFLTDKIRREFKSWFDADLKALPVMGSLTAYGPPPASTIDLRQMFSEHQPDTLGIWNFSPDQRYLLAAALAPVYFQDVVQDYDIPGKIRWANNRVCVDTKTPVVYYYTSQAYLADQPVFQINYVTWYAGRMGPNAPWIERGHLDGITLRVTLDLRGEPFMVDIMNNCGCYHFFVPRKKRVQRLISRPWKLDPYAPQWLPEAFPSKRVGVRINSGWHQVQRVLAVDSPDSHHVYRLIPYAALEMLPTGSTRTESIFDARGILKGSQRIEPLLLFPMGVPDVGSMRQRAHHPIVLVGRSHFDDPELFNQSFEFKEPH